MKIAKNIITRNSHRQLFCMLIVIAGILPVCSQVGIGTESPFRSLEVAGTGSKHIRAHVSTLFGGDSGLELVRGTGWNPQTDWKIVNEVGILKIYSGNYKLYNASTEHLRITDDNFVGLNTSSVLSPLHIGSGEAVSVIGDGYMLLGDKSNFNMAFGHDRIQARNGGSPSTLYVNSYGGDSFVSSTGGDILLGHNDGRLGIGTSNPQRKVHVKGTDWHMYLSNYIGPAGWYIGASNAAWALGDQKLIFSPTSSSNNAVMTLTDVNDNDGVSAPVSFRSQNGQEMLLDGNEIDTKSGALYINYNSGHTTLLNPTGGQVAIGTTQINGYMNVLAPPDTYALSLEADQGRWDVTMTTPSNINAGDMDFYYNNVLTCGIQGFAGWWWSSSDRKRKNSFQPVENVLDGIRGINAYTYSFKSNPSQKSYYGVLAQEVALHFPEVVRSTEHFTGVSYGQLAVLVLRALQEQQALIKLLESEIASLESN